MPALILQVLEEHRGMRASSAHPTMVNHLLCDGSVKPLLRDFDYAAYFFYITRNNGDPFLWNND